MMFTRRDPEVKGRKERIGPGNRPWRLRCADFTCQGREVNEDHRKALIALSSYREFFHSVQLFCATVYA